MMVNSHSSNSNDRWEELAEFWDAHTHSGNDFYHKIVAPIARELLQLKSSHRILEVACSSGLFSRELAQEVECVTATDVSQRFIQIAKERSNNIKNLTFSVLDATQASQIRNLGRNKFNGAVCNMALMDMPEIAPLFEGLSYVLERGSHFVVTLLHPCFNSPGLNFFMESSIKDNQIVTQKGMKVSHYLTSVTFEQFGILGQPTPHYFFHRSLQDILNPAFNHGWVLDGLKEQTLPYEPESAGAPLTRQNFPEIPAVLGLRFKVL